MVEPSLLIVDEDPTAKTQFAGTSNHTSDALNSGAQASMDLTFKSVMEEPSYWLHDIEYLYLRSFNELEGVFRTEFKESKAFEEMVLELNSNLIEYKFLHKAGIIKAS